MIHINKAKGGYIGYVVAKNGEILSTTEIVKTKENIYKNLLAQSDEYKQILLIRKKDKSKPEGHLISFENLIILQDNTLPTAKLLFCCRSEKKDKVKVWFVSEAEMKQYKLKVKKFKSSV